MAIKEFLGSMNVVEAARTRIRNLFGTGLPIMLSTSGGKDSICLMSLVYDLIVEGLINKDQLTVAFIDEEAIFDDVEKIVIDWRKKFMLLGVKFDWYCIQAKHFNCLRTLSDDESFILWDEWEKQNWVRKMPKFAIKTHPLLRERTDTYQDFLFRLVVQTGSLSLIGTRAAESLQRRKHISFSLSKKHPGQIGGKGKAFPIYDWSDDDVWLYIKKNNLDFPVAYMYIYQTGGGRRDMRISQFFSVDTAKSLVRLSEMYPDLMERIQKREPNAYLASLYWHTEVFGGREKDKKQKEQNKSIDWKQKAFDRMEYINETYPDAKEWQSLVRSIKRLLINLGAEISNELYEEIYRILVGGDPKLRAVRVLDTKILTQTNKNLNTRKRG